MDDRMTPQTSNPLDSFHWIPQPAAEQLVGAAVDDFLARTPAAMELARRMKDETGTRFIDWIDHLVLPPSDARRSALPDAGFHLKADGPDAGVFIQEAGLFPPVRVDGEGRFGVAIAVESIVDFAAANHLPLITVDGPLSIYRQLMIAKGQGTEFQAVERHGFRGFAAPPPSSPAHRLEMLRHEELFRTRRRDFESDEEAFDALERQIAEAIENLGVDVACDRFFAAERWFWQGRNRAAQVQYARQQRLGLGWANHDHHTYRSSRRHFRRMIGLFETLGFHCRERFYAGAEAGWGAQVLEQPAARIVIFADVDLSPDELVQDFAHQPLAPRQGLGTVGLWCGLHGDSILAAGMHHLECRFDFDALRRQLESVEGIHTMKPFTEMPYLKQAFTEGQRWPVRKQRIDRLAAAGQITPDQARQFRDQGAIGSHLENLQRDQGFKGFNQQGVNDIIARTDPRN